MVDDSIDESCGVPTLRELREGWAPGKTVDPLPGQKGGASGWPVNRPLPARAPSAYHWSEVLTGRSLHAYPEEKHHTVRS